MRKLKILVIMLSTYLNPCRERKHNIENKIKTSWIQRWNETILLSTQNIIRKQNQIKLPTQYYCKLGVKHRAENKIAESHLTHLFIYCRLSGCCYCRRGEMKSPGGIKIRNNGFRPFLKQSVHLFDKFTKWKYIG